MSVRPAKPSAGAPALSAALTDPWKRVFRRRLLAWYARHARDLPWRRVRDPYLVWVSEVMLQQTQVETVRPYFERFCGAFPSVGALARAHEDQVLRLWEGLGYYRRARALHAAARQVVELHGGRLPEDVPTLMTLSGVGRYTAGAIASIAYNHRAPIVEANTQRLYARLVALRGAVSGGAQQKRLWQVAEELLPGEDASTFNQALMDLGALVCTPRGPRCAECPVASLCHARRQGLVGAIPASTKRPATTETREAAVVVRRGERVLVRRCGPGERWAGLWDFPRFPLEGEPDPPAGSTLADGVHRLTGARCTPGGRIATLRHGVTRYRITLECYEATHAGGRLRAGGDAASEWATLDRLAELPLSVTGRKIVTLLRAGRTPRPA